MFRLRISSPDGEFFKDHYFKTQEQMDTKGNSLAGFYIAIGEEVPKDDLFDRRTYSERIEDYYNQIKA